MRKVLSARGAVALCFALFFAVGLFTLGDYGTPWDEQDEMDILRMNAWEYARAFGLDTSAFEARSQAETLSISAIVPISQSVERDHGQAAFLPLMGIVENDQLSEHTRSLWWHGWCWALFTLGAFGVYAACVQLGLPRWTALCAAAMLLLSPRFFAEGHYNNKDTVLMALIACVLWQAIGLMKKPTFPRAIWFALFGALAANAKLTGFLLWGLCGVAVICHHAWQKTLRGRTWSVGVAALGAFLAFYVLMTPAMWADPIGFLSYLIQNTLAFSRWENLLLFRGAVFDLSKQSLPWYYLPYMILATTPLWALFLMGAGQLVAVRRIHKPASAVQRSGLLMISLAWLLPLAAAVITRTHVYNGWRHFYFLYAPMLMLGATGLHALWQHFRFRRTFAALLGACVLLTGIGIATQHPYQYAYYQPLVQWRQADGAMEVDHWNVSATNALEALSDAVEGDIAIGWSDLWSEHGVRHALAAMPESVASRFLISETAPRYVLENPTYTTFSGFTPPEGARCAVELSAYGRVLMRVWEVLP